MPYQSVRPSVHVSIHPSYSQYVTACDSLFLKLVQGVTSTYMEVQMCGFYRKPETTSGKDYLTYIVIFTSQKEAVEHILADCWAIYFQWLAPISKETAGPLK